MSGVGAAFRAAREARGLSLSDVAEQIHIRPVYLQGIEDEDWAAVGAQVYVRGFMRTYARFLNLDGESFVSRYNELASSSGAPARVRPQNNAALLPPAPHERRPVPPTVWIWTGVAAAVIAFIGYSLFVLIAGNSAARPEAAATASPADPTLAPAALRDRSQTLIVRLIEPSWVSVVVDGREEFVGTAKPGSEYVFHGKRAGVRTGNAGGLDVTVNGQEAGTLGAMGAVVERSYDLTH